MQQTGKKQYSKDMADLEPEAIAGILSVLLRQQLNNKPENSNHKVDLELAAISGLLSAHSLQPLHFNSKDRVGPGIGATVEFLVAQICSCFRHSCTNTSLLMQKLP